MNLTTEQNELLTRALKWQRVGSSVTCDPVPHTCDFDYLILLAAAKVTMFCDDMQSLGFDIELGAGYAANCLKDQLNADAFNSYRADDVNFIITCSHDFYHKFVVATDLAKRFNLLKKSDRIALFQGVLYHNRPIPDLPPLPMFKPAPVDSN